MNRNTSRPRQKFSLALLVVFSLLHAATATNISAQQRFNAHSSLAAPNNAQQGLSISYELGMSRPTTHLFEVTMTVANISAPQIDVEFPVWVPGAYRVVDAARNVQEFRAGTTGGQSLPVRKTHTNSWRVETRGANAVRVSYKVYADNFGVSGAHLDDTHAFFNGSLIFPYVVGAKERPVTLTVNRPPRWTTISTGLEPVAARPNTFAAPDYDTFVDAPFEIGTHNVLRFDYKGAAYEIAIYGTHNYDLERFRAETESMVRSQVDMMGGAPFRRYVFIFHMLPRGGGGLEHLNSTAINLRKFAGNTEDGWERFRGVTSHEFFHLWNVKRLRPGVLGPFDYTQPVTTRDLYVSEGMTSYYGSLHIMRSGLWTRERFYRAMSNEIRELQSLPGRRIQTVEESSINTWYSHDDPLNTSFSYYNKGDLLGMLLDLEIRQRTKNARSLDDVFRYLLENFGLPKAGWEPGGFQKAVETVAGSDFGEFFTRYVGGVEELPYERALGYAGLRLEKKEAPPFDFGVEFDDTAAYTPTQTAPQGGVGATFSQLGSGQPTGIVVNGVSSESPAYNVLASNDILLAIGGERVAPSTLQAQLARFRNGERVLATIFRGDRLLEVSWVMRTTQTAAYTITEDPNATPEQRAIRDSWLRGAKPPTATPPSAVGVARNGQAVCAPCTFSSSRTITANEANASFIQAGQRPPYALTGDVQEVVLQEETIFSRVHGERNQPGMWIMPRSEIEGLTPAQIRDRFALPDMPVFVSDVYVPAGTRLRVGTVGAQAGWGSGGAIQYQLMERLPTTAFRNRRTLR
ncbi:MAG TPA: hypothetical protein VF666_03920 [Pyrinomonadaceae bacterium]|jgi:predicted metalloprotease with PDZ domain